MRQSREDKPVGAVWRRVCDLAPEYHALAHDGARRAAERWRGVRARLESTKTDRTGMDIWLREQRRAFAIETGQIEDLYLLRRGVTETLIAEGFENVRGVHSVSSIGDETLKGLLVDQEAALEMVFSLVKNERPLTASAIKEWHALLTRHQDTATGRSPTGRRVAIPLLKGMWKIRPNNPVRQDGFVHEYCPPEQVQSEIDRFLAMHAGHHALDLAPETEAAWLHHEFVRIHPFQDGNGRISRLLMAYAYARAGEFPPVIPAENKLAYINALEEADEGNFGALVEYFGDLAAPRSNEAALRAEGILRGRDHYRHGNGGVTRDGTYHPPVEGLPLEREPLPLHNAVRDGDLDALHSLLDAGEHPDTLEQMPDSRPTTALQLAAGEGKTEVVRILLEAGARTDITDVEGWTVLHVAAQHAGPDTVQLLIAAGADVGARGPDNATALHLAARRGDADAASAIIGILLDAGAGPLLEDDEGHTPRSAGRRNPALAGTAGLERLGAASGQAGPGPE